MSSLVLTLVSQALAATPTVSSIDALRAAVAAAAAGDVITLAPGTYRVDRTIPLAAAGTEAAPITLRGPGAVLESDTVEAFKVTGAHWHVEDLAMRGVCADDSQCEHAFHVVGAADGTWIRRTTLVDFNAQIKGNGEDVDGVRIWPSDVQLVGNDLHDTRPRVTANPVTKIDVVGGQRWRVEANRIADFEKGGGDTVSYAAFLKGNSKDGVFARNLVVCADRFEGGVRVGLSLGGGGTSPDSICEDGTCTPEHARGTLVNNVIAHCSDVGIYLNEAAESVVWANTLVGTSGIDVRFAASTVTLANNVLDGRIRERDGGTATRGTNLSEVDLTTVHTDPAALDLSLRDGSDLLDVGDLLVDVTEDYCGHARTSPHDLGAIDYAAGAPCDARVVHLPDDAAPGDTGTDDTDVRDTSTDDTGVRDTSVRDLGVDARDVGGDETAGCGCASGPQGTPRSGRTLASAVMVVAAFRRRRTRG